ncbi:MAG: DUF1700 domain-containing protein [Clostridia bacterium]|nr:DUF1700 domain-containing protein [Clostridia bacterium]
MTKREFLGALSKRLEGIPQQDRERSLDFYEEMISDRMEEGYTEEEAVSAIGSVDAVAMQTIADIPFAKIAKERIKPKHRLRAWEIVLLAVGSPIWLSLGIAAFAVFVSLYAVLWSLIVSIWAVFVSLVACAFGGASAGIVLAVIGKPFSGVALLAAGIFCVGLAIFLFFGCKAATKGVLLLTKKISLGIKTCFVKKEEKSCAR